ncbi:MAG TPA: hypothetical protein VG324_22350 [Blastocatellia bacterium]|nr:hypothetical protein [Blastocatellia bacterium]
MLSHSTVSEFIRRQPPALGVLPRPEWAALAMSASTVTVTIKALRLNRVCFATDSQAV